MGAWRRSGLAAAAVALAVTGSVSAFAAASGASPAPAAPLVEAASCAAPTPLPAVDGSRTGGDTVVSFQVPARTLLQVEAGDVTAAATNTGCAPRAGDTFVVDDRAATGSEAAAALAVAWSGDWTTPGAWHPAG